MLSKCRKSQDDDAPVFVVKLAPSGPAFLDGTLSFGDELLCIDDVSCKGMSLMQITAMLVGARGSFVKLSIRQDGEKLHDVAAVIVPWACCTVSLQPAMGAACCTRAMTVLTPIAGYIKEVGLERAVIPTPHGVETRSRADAPSQREHVQNGHTPRHHEHIQQGRSHGQANRALLEAPELIPLGTDVQMERGRIPWRSPLSPQLRDRSEAFDGFRPNQPAALSARRSSPPPRPSMASSTGQMQTRQQIRTEVDSPPRSSGPVYTNFGEISDEDFRASHSEVYTAAGVSRRAGVASGEDFFNHLGSIPLSPSSFLERHHGVPSHNAVMATDVITSDSPVYCWGSPETSNQPPAHPSHAIAPDPFIYRPSSASVSIHPDTRAGIGLIQDSWARAHPFVPTVGHSVARPMSPVLGHESKAITGRMPLPFNAMQPNLSPPPPFPMGQYTAFPVLSPRIQPRNVENGMTKPLRQGAALPPAAVPPTASRPSSHRDEKSAAPEEVKSVGLSDMQALKEICRRQAQQVMCAACSASIGWFRVRVLA